MSYKKGRSFEYRVKYFFEKEGFSVVRSSGSHTSTDIVVSNGYKNFFIQCKSDKSYLNRYIINNYELLKNGLIKINNIVFMFNRETLKNLIVNNDNNYNIKHININATKKFNEIIDYLKYNDFVIINYGRKKDWIVFSKELQIL